MAQLSQQSDKYAIDFQSAIETAVECSKGIDTDKSGIFILSHSDLSSNQTILDVLKAIKSASRHSSVEYANTNKNPRIQLQTLYSPKNVYPVFRTFFQKGVVDSTIIKVLDANGTSYNCTTNILDADGNVIKVSKSVMDADGNSYDVSITDIEWFYPYSYEENGGVCNSWATIVRGVSTGDTNSHRMIGAICDNFSISVSADDYIYFNANMPCRDVEYSYNASGDNFTLSTDSPFLWRNCVTKLGNSYNPLETFDLKSFDLSVSNNAKARLFNNSKIQKFNLGRVTGNGKFITPWENTSTNFQNVTSLSDLFAGNVCRLSLYWGNQYASTAFTSSINVLLRYNNENIANDSELSNDMSFTLVEDFSFSTDNNKITSWSVDSASADTINFVFPSTETLLGNVFPGDVIRTPDASSGATDNWIIESITDINTLKLKKNHSAGLGATGTKVTIVRHPINIGLNRDIS
jgi:hypothetical protein